MRCLDERVGQLRGCVEQNSDGQPAQNRGALQGERRSQPNLQSSGRQSERQKNGRRDNEQNQIRATIEEPNDSNGREHKPFGECRKESSGRGRWYKDQLRYGLVWSDVESN